MTLTPSTYVLGRFLRSTDKYITAKAASNTPPNIKIRVVTISSGALYPSRVNGVLRLLLSGTGGPGRASGD